jgi:hypothetical protein
MVSDAVGGANGGSAGARTQDQYLKRVLLYQLSYRPVRWRGGRDNTLAPARCTHRLLSASAPRVAPAAARFGLGPAQWRWRLQAVTLLHWKDCPSRPRRSPVRLSVRPRASGRVLDLMLDMLESRAMSSASPAEWWAGTVAEHLDRRNIRIGGKRAPNSAPARSTMVRTLNNNLQEDCYSRARSVCLTISLPVYPRAACMRYVGTVRA